jgi:RNA polymerase sigma-70 factor (ECF subfamily)
VDRARARNAGKRDSAGYHDESSGHDPQQLDTLVVDQALSRMSHHYPRCAQVVELRFFGDLELREIADMMELSLATVERDWRFARAWLRKSIQGGAHE